MGLIDWLASRQATLGMDDTRFADHLGISRASWSCYQSGRRRPGLGVVQKAVAKFPEDRDAILFCAIDVPIGNIPAVAVA